MSAARPKKGDYLVWRTDDGEVLITVTRTARDRSWADIRCTDRHGHVWTKRQPLPFPVGFLAVKLSVA